MFAGLWRLADAPMSSVSSSSMNDGALMGRFGARGGCLCLYVGEDALYALRQLLYSSTSDRVMDLALSWPSDAGL